MEYCVELSLHYKWDVDFSRRYGVYVVAPCERAIRDVGLTYCRNIDEAGIVLEACLCVGIKMREYSWLEYLFAWATGEILGESPLL